MVHSFYNRFKSNISYNPTKAWYSGLLVKVLGL